MSMGRLRRRLGDLLLLDESPQRTAATYGFGVFIGFSPFIGFHTVMALTLLFLFPLNRLALLAGVYTNTPWTLAPAASLGTALGFWILGTEASFPALSREVLATPEFRRELLSNAEKLLAPFLLGNLVLAAGFAFVGYVLARRILSRYRRKSTGANVPAAVSE